MALKVAEKLGFTDRGSIGERLSFEKEIEKQVEKAENRAERYEQYAENAVERGKQLRSSLDAMHGDIAFFTQPVINSASGRTFANYREKLFNRYRAGFEEYRKSEYFKEKARTAEETASMSKFKDKTYLDNRIKECNKSIKQLEKNVVKQEGYLYRLQQGEVLKRYDGTTATIEKQEERIEELLEKMEYEMDKLAYLENCMDALDGVKYSKENIKEGYLVKIRGTWRKVIKASKINVESKIIEGGAAGMVLKHSYAEIQEMEIPEGYVESENEIKNPYVAGDILVCYNVSGNRVIKAYQVVKTTAKGVQLQSIKIESNKPVKDSFTSDKAIRKQITKSKYSDFVGCYDDGWQLNKYVDNKLQLVI